MSVKSIATASVPVVVGIFAAGFLFYYLGDNKVVKMAQQGLNG